MSDEKIDIGVAVIWLGIFYSLLHVIGFSTKWYIEKIEKIFGTVNLLQYSIVLVILSLLVAFYVDEPWIVFVAILLSIIFFDVRLPVFANFMNKRIESRSRATTLSNLNVIKGVLDVPILLISGYLVSIDLVYGFWAAIVLCLIVLIGFPIRQRDLEK